MLKSREILHGRELDVVVDRQTGVNYVTYLASASAPLNPLLDKDGKPLVDELPLENV
ncbi:MAG TPA: xylan 1,4-beta-xylosidase [Candidatus Acutalibacter stercoravium]|nr:xylan 1,4-beta-xylosidase [Candidatus Acutalibacter stercoravium]